MTDSVIETDDLPVTTSLDLFDEMKSLTTIVDSALDCFKVVVSLT